MQGKLEFLTIEDNSLKSLLQCLTSVATRPQNSYPCSNINFGGWMFSWVAAAFSSAFFAGVVSILAKCGIKSTDSDVATAFRTCVVAVFCWVMVAIVGSFNQISTLTTKTWIFLLLSGAATGASWICYFKALSLGDVNKVVPIDKSSTLMAVLLSIVLFAETNNLALKLAGTVVATVGTFMMIEKKERCVQKQKNDVGKNFNQAGSAFDGKMEDGESTSGQKQEFKHANRKVAIPNAAEGRANSSQLFGKVTQPRAVMAHQSYLIYAFLAAVFAALTSVLAKVGIQGVESNLATAIRTMVVLVIAWGIVIGKGKIPFVRKVRHSELLFLVASGIATGASWLFFYYAIQVGQVSVVVQIDKLSLLISILFASVVFKERLSRKSTVGLVLIVFGTAIVTACS